MYIIEAFFSKDRLIVNENFSAEINKTMIPEQYRQGLALDELEESVI